MNFSVLILSLLNCSKTMWSYDSLVDLQKRLAYSNPIQALFKPYSNPDKANTLYKICPFSKTELTDKTEGNQAAVHCPDHTEVKSDMHALLCDQHPFIYTLGQELNHKSRGYPTPSYYPYLCDSAK